MIIKSSILRFSLLPCNFSYYLANCLRWSRFYRMTLIIYQNLLRFFLANDMNCVKLTTFYVIKLSVGLFSSLGFDKIIMSWFSIWVKNLMIILRRFNYNRVILWKNRKSEKCFNEEEKILLKENEKGLYISARIMLKSIVSKKSVNTSLSMYLIIFYVIKKFDFAFE